MNCVSFDRRHGGHNRRGRPWAGAVADRQEPMVYDDFCMPTTPMKHATLARSMRRNRSFKIDYDEPGVHSPDPSDPKVTKRVITIMLAEEY